MSGPDTQFLARSTTLIGDPPPRILRFARTSNILLIDDGEEPSRRRIRVATQPAPTARHRRVGGVAFLITVGNEVTPRRIDVECGPIRPSDTQAA